VRLSVTDAKVGIPGHFVGLQNFEKIWNDDIFHVAVWNTCVYTAVATVFSSCSVSGSPSMLNHNFKGKAFYPRVHPAALSSSRPCLSTLAWKWMFDPPSASSTGCWFRLGLIHSRIIGSGDPNLALISVIVRQCLARFAVLAISLLAGLQAISPVIARGRGDRRGKSLAALRHVTWPLLLPVTLVIVLFLG